MSILGERYTHGHVFDFYKQLQADPGILRVLGDGRQRKSYLYVHDCIDAMLLAIQRSEARINILNLGTDSYCAVNDSIKWICETLGVRPKIERPGGVLTYLKTRAKGGDWQEGANYGQRARQRMFGAFAVVASMGGPNYFNENRFTAETTSSNGIPALKCE